MGSHVAGDLPCGDSGVLARGALWLYSGAPLGLVQRGPGSDLLVGRYRLRVLCGRWPSLASWSRCGSGVFTSSRRGQGRRARRDSRWLRMRQFIFSAHFVDNPGRILELEALAVAGAACPDLGEIIEM